MKEGRQGYCLFCERAGRVQRPSETIWGETLRVQMSILNFGEYQKTEIGILKTGMGLEVRVSKMVLSY